MDEENAVRPDKEAAAEKLATASFVLGIISLVSVLCCCPFVFSAIGIILALLSKGAKKQFRPRAKTGFILSIVGIFVSLIIMAITIAFPIFMFKTNPEYKREFIKSYEETIEMNEDTLREIYGDETYEEMLEMMEDL